MEHTLLAFSTFCFLFGFAYTMVAVGRGHYRHSQFNFYAILLGFLFQTGFLYLRGQTLHRCPLTNAFEVLVFLSWSLVLFYLVIGTAYRISLLGAFTSPLAFVLQICAIVFPLDRPAPAGNPPGAWLEMHAALSVLAYGAFALAGVAGVMYLAQERQLKTHNLRALFFHLPPIAELAVANRRLLLCGFALLSAGLAAGFLANEPVGALKLAGGVVIWLIYGALWLSARSQRVSPRLMATCSIVAFAVAFGSLWGLNFIAEKTCL